MNHWIRIIGIVGLILSLGLGCATQRTAPDPDYVLYQQAVKEQKPLVSIEWNEDMTKMKKLDVYPQLNIQQKQQDAPHPIWGVITTAVRGVLTVWGIVEIGNAAEGLAGSVQGNSSYTAGGNMSGGSMEIPTTTTTTTTETITGIEPLLTE